MPLHDLICIHCHLRINDFYRSPWPEEIIHFDCGKPLEITWSKAPQASLGCHSKDVMVVWEDPQTGKVLYPPRNDVPIPERYQKLGYQRKELNTLKEVERFEAQHGVRNESIWFDRNGRGFDTHFRGEPYE